MLFGAMEQHQVKRVNHSHSLLQQHFAISRKIEECRKYLENI